MKRIILLLALAFSLASSGGIRTAFNPMGGKAREKTLPSGYTYLANGIRATYGSLTADWDVGMASGFDTGFKPTADRSQYVELRARPIVVNNWGCLLGRRPPIMIITRGNCESIQTEQSIIRQHG